MKSLQEDENSVGPPDVSNVQSHSSLSSALQIGASAFVAELWGLRDGLILCSNLNILCLIVEVDNSALVDALLNSEYVNLVVSPLLDDCRLLLSQFHQVQIRHCFRQANRCADVMARMGSVLSLDFPVFLSPPVDALEAFEADLNGLCFVRRCPVRVVGF
ncbi:uncharacterized protein LOC111989670 [Quercus suber]|uniref:uncharacterized protein LOC111989670 n=1 Tax=Quercus suber TaxID=58331 RepID=UPI0032DED9FA